MAAAFALSLAGCAVGPDFISPDAPAASHFTDGKDPTATVAAEGTQQQFTAFAALPADWWRLFGTPALDVIVRQGLAGSPTMVAAEANLRAAQHNLRAGQGVFFPQLNADGSALREHPSANGPGQVPDGVFNIFTLSATVSYTLDIFGGERRMVEGLGAEAEIQRNIARAASLTLAANIVNTVIAAAAADAQITAMSEMIALEREQVRLASAQMKAGTIAYAGVLSLQAQLDANEALLPPMRQKLVQAQNLLAVLVGRLPSDGPTPRLAFGELSLPHELPVSLPSALVRQRPDILQAEASLHVASAGIGVATAALLPSFTLDGSLGLESISAANLIGAGSRFWNVGAGLTTPIFHGGTLWYQRKAAIDAFDAATANYRQTVLAAFQQVADTLRGLEHDAEGLAAEERALHTATRAADLTRANFNAGIVPYADLLLADALVHQARIAEIAYRATRYQDTVALFVALGGGWWNVNATNLVTDAAPPPLVEPKPQLNQ